jgi:hypothetical protein
MPKLFYVTVTHPVERRARKRWQFRYYVLAQDEGHARWQIEQEYSHYDEQQLAALEIVVKPTESQIVSLGPARAANTEVK